MNLLVFLLVLVYEQLDEVGGKNWKRAEMQSQARKDPKPLTWVMRIKRSMDVLQSSVSVPKPTS